MADPAWSLQQMLYTELTAAGLTVYPETAPSTATYPFVTIGADLSDDDGSKDQDAWLFNVDIQCWTETREYSVVKLMAGTIRDRINRQQFTQDGYRIYQIREATTRYFAEEDGHGRRGVLEYQIRIGV